MLVLGKLARDPDEGRKLAEKAISEGRAIGKFRTLVDAQGGDGSYVDDPDKFPKAKYIEVVESPEGGYLEQVQARIIGEAAVALGAGRAKKGDLVDHAVGFVVHRKVGDRIEKGQPLFTVHANDESLLVEARQAVLAAYRWADAPVPELPLFYD